MEPTREQMKELLRLVSATRSEEFDCDQFLSNVGAFLECTGKRGDLPPELEAVRQHLEVCPACQEEFELLVQAFKDGEP